uniref:Lysosome-associated membrane glycoprotein 5 n=3 Tax=Lygus hesperus TaxID=30085 RepID=A0A0A9VYE2_LYGHE
MKLTAVLFGVAFVVSAVSAKPEDAPTNAPQEVTTIKTPNTTSTVPPPVSSTKPDEPTSIAPPPSSSSTTLKPTPPPITPSTTPSPAPTTPSPAPTTPSTAPTTPSPAPSTTPKPVPKEYYWRVTDEKGAICILAKADITLKLTYTNETAGKKEQISKEIKISPNATSSGTCDEKNQVLTLTLDNTTISFNFNRNDSENYHLSQIKSNVTLDNALNNQSVISLASDELKVFKTKLNTSYECRWSEPAVLKEVDEYFNVTKATLRVNMDNIRIEAFRDMAGDNFAKAYACEMDNTDLVPIMVGIALGILVAVVLIAYLVGRRNTQAQGYLSM